MKLVPSDEETKMKCDFRRIKSMMQINNNRTTPGCIFPWLELRDNPLCDYQQKKTLRGKGGREWGVKTLLTNLARLFHSCDAT